MNIGVHIFLMIGSIVLVMQVVRCKQVWEEFSIAIRFGSYPAKIPVD